MTTEIFDSTTLMNSNDDKAKTTNNHPTVTLIL